MSTLTQVSKAMQSVLSVDANRLARQCGVVQRARKLTGASLAQALVFGWLHRPDATIEQLAQMTAVCGKSVRPQAIDQRFRESTAQFFHKLLQAAIGQVVTADSASVALLQRFEGVWLEDSTVIRLPTCFADQWPACGGANSQSKAALKLYVELDLSSGRLVGPQCVPGRQSDHHSTLVEAIPPRGIHVADLGYFDLAQLQELDTRGVYWITRIQSSTGLYDEHSQPLEIARLMRGREEMLDQPVQVGSRQQLAARLIVSRAPSEVVRKRRCRLEKEARRRGRTVSQGQRDWCRWTVMVTNIPVDQLSVHEAFVLLKMRWQIELLFKRWKSLGRVGHSRSKNPWRIFIETYAKLLGMVIQHWLLLLTTWQYDDRSLAKSSIAVQDHVLSLVEPLATGRRLNVALRRFADILKATGRLQHRKAKPASYQLLRNTQAIDST